VNIPSYNEARAEITSMVFSPTGKRLVVLCRNYIAKTVDLGDGLGNRSISNCYSASQAMFVRDGRMLLINGAGDGFADGVIQLCESTGTPVVKYMAAASQDRYATAFRLSRDGSSILTSSQGGTLQVFDFRTGARRGLTNRITSGWPTAIYPGRDDCFGFGS